MKDKMKGLLMNPEKKQRAAVTAATALGTIGVFAPFAFASGSTKQMDDVFKQVLEIVFKIFQYIGALLGIWGVAMLILAFKNEDPDSKQRGIMMMVAAIGLLSIRPIANAIINASKNVSGNVTL